MTLIRSNSVSTPKDIDLSAVKQPKQIQRTLDNIGVDLVKPVKPVNLQEAKIAPKQSSSEKVENAISKSIENLESSGKKLSAIKVSDLWKIKDGLKKVEAGSGVDKSKEIPKSAMEKASAEISTTLKQSIGVMSYITGNSEKSDAFQKFDQKNSKNENVDFLKSAESFLKNPSMENLKSLYTNKMKNTSVNPQILNELSKSLEIGNPEKSMALLKTSISDVIKDISDNSLTKFMADPQFTELTVNKTKTDLLKNFAVDNDNKNKLGELISNPQKQKVLDKFSLKDHSFEDVKFLSSVNNLLKKDKINAADLAAIYTNYLAPDGNAQINLQSKQLQHVSAFKAAVENNDINTALKNLEPLINKSKENACDTLARFYVSDDYKGMVKDETVGQLNHLIQPKNSEKFDYNKVIFTKEFADHCNKEFSSENIDFMKEVKNKLPNISMDDLQAIKSKYIGKDAEKEINVPSKSLGAFNKAMSEGNHQEALYALVGLTKSVNENIDDTFGRFKATKGFSDIVGKDILKPIEKLPLRKQLAALDEAIKSEPTSASVIREMKTDLLNKYMPKIPVNGDPTSFVSGFKKATSNLKTSVFGGEIDNVYKALDNFKNVYANNPKDGRAKLEAMDKAIKQVDGFIQKRGTESSKTEWVQALGGRLSEARTSLMEEMSKTEDGKLYHVGSGIDKLISESKTQASPNFDTMAESLKSKAKEMVAKDPNGELAWSIATLHVDSFKDRTGDTFKGIKDEIRAKVESSFTKLKPEEKEILTDKIFEGYQEGLPAKKKGESFIVDGEEYKITKRLASGAFGTVYKAESESGKTLAIKQFDRAYIFSAEVEAHRLVNGKPEYKNNNVTDFKGAVIDSKNGNYFCIQEFVDGGDLKGLIGKLNEAEASNKFSHSDIINVKRYLAENVIKGMVHVNEDRDMLHLDIKPDNIMFDKTRGTVKIADFGTADKNSLQEGFVGTPGYTAPEVGGKMGKAFDKTADNWSIGATLQELMTGEKTFENIDQTGEFASTGQQLREVAGKAEPTALGKMINGLMQTDPAKRTKFSDLLKESYFTDPIGTDERAKEVLKMITE